MKVKIQSIIIVFWLCITMLYAGTTGKIAGIVRDAENKAPLPGVNVFLEGTSLGAATDAEGYYTILNIPPGRYELNVNYVGYADYMMKNVVVRIDLTTRIDVDMKSEIIEADVVVVEAERPVIVKDISNSQMNIEAEAIGVLPIQTVNEMLTLQAGIEMGSQGIRVRGGDERETIFMIDGLNTNDERGNVPFATISLSSIKEIQVQTGGFSAEYGDARSGLVNVITIEGEKTSYSGSFTATYSPAAPKYFGESIYSPYSYFNRPFMDPTVCWTGTDNGAWDSNTRKQYPNFEGWISIAEKTLKDDNPSNDLTPEGAKKLFEWQRRRDGDIKESDYILDFGFGGPIPFISDKLGNLRFFLSHFKEREMFIIPLSTSGYNVHNTQLKFTSDIAPALKLLINGSYSEESSVSPYQWTTTPTGRILRSQSEIADLTNTNDGAAILYMPGYFSPSIIYRSSLGLKLTHALNPKVFYEAKLQFRMTKYHTYKTDDRDLTTKYEPVSGYFVDEAPYGYYGYGLSAIDGSSMGGWMNLGRDNSRSLTTTFSFDLTGQVNPKNQIKTGLTLIYDDFDVNSTTESPSMKTWTRSMIFRVFPYRIGMYVTDKLEIEGFIANLGLRADYSDPNGDTYSLNVYDQYYQSGYGNQLEQKVAKEKAKAEMYISPRLGISHPITENSKLYFNYGHFTSEPAPDYRFRIQREYYGLVTFIGNPDLKLEKTISYELGYEHNLISEFLLKVAGYYKDITNQPGWVYYTNIQGTVKYNKPENNNYEDIRGFEITLSKQYGKWVRGFINYTYMVSTSGYFGLREYWQDPNQQRSYLQLNPYQTKPHPLPYARANIYFFTPADFGPDWFGFWPLADWNLNILADWRTGAYYTYNPNNIPGIIDDTQWKDWYNVDIRLSKIFSFSKTVQLTFYLDVTNVFNFKHMNYAGFSDNYDWEAYLQSLNFSWEKGDEHGQDRIGESRPVSVAFDPLEPNPDNDPTITDRNNERKKNKSYIDMPNIKSFAFLNPRDIIFGLKINF